MWKIILVIWMTNLKEDKLEVLGVQVSFWKKSLNICSIHFLKPNMSWNIKKMESMLWKTEKCLYKCENFNTQYIQALLYYFKETNISEKCKKEEQIIQRKNLKKKTKAIWRLQYKFFLLFDNFKINIQSGLSWTY